MKLFSLPDGTIDYKDRAQWLTQPFDLVYAAAVNYVMGMRIRAGELEHGQTAVQYEGSPHSNVSRNRFARGDVKRG